MKKIALLFTLAVSSFAVNAQTPHTLSTSPYTQNFDDMTIDGGLPDGWGVYTGSSDTSIGTFYSFSSSLTFGIFGDTTACGSSVNGKGFKNYASADVVSPTASCDDQQAVSNRALGVHQVGPTTAPGWDSGAAFVFSMTNTTGLTNFKLAFNLQSLDQNNPRVVTWMVDYAIGNTSNFIPVTATTGSWQTGGNTFTNNANTVDFGTALDNQSQQVWVRVVTLDYSSGSGSRPCSAIDDWNLTYEGTTGVANVTGAANLPLTVLGAATSNNINLGYTANETGSYTLTICDMAGRVVRTQTVNATAGSQHLALNNLGLSSGLYIAKMTDGKTSGIAKISVQ